LRDLTQHLTTRADDNHAPPVSTLRPYSPGGLLIVLTPARKGSDPPHLVIIVYSVDYQGI